MAISPAPIGASPLVPETLKAVRPCAKCGASDRYARGECKPCKKAGNAARYAANSDKEKAKMAARYAANSDKEKAGRAARYAANPDKHKASSAAWAAKNPEACKIIHQNRRARKNKAEGTLSKGLTQKLFKLQKGKCPCCGLPLGDNYHLDHRTPLALGGAHADDNMQLLRKICNLQKHARDPVEFMQSRGFLL